MNARRLFDFNVWPVVQRELRESARRPINHRLRFWSVLIGTLLLRAVVVASNHPPAQLGSWLFACLHTLLLALIFLIVPGLTADCISRERREGTLGLLFLTPLSAGGIVAGKALTQALRMLTFWLAALPLLTIPFLAGGVTWFDALSALSLQFDATVLCLAAGLLASTLSEERNRAYVLAYLFAAFFIFVLSQVFQGVIWFGWYASSTRWLNDWWSFSRNWAVVYSGLLEEQGSSAGWSMFFNFSAVLRTLWIELCLVGPPCALLIFWFVARVAARRLEHSWQDQGPSPRRESLLRTYCTPVFQNRFRRRMRRSLDGNPIAWLQQYSWPARAGKWLLCLAFLLVVCATSSGHEARESVSDLLRLTLAVIYTVIGVGGFLEEKRNGALELLLVTPISVNNLIFGRVAGLWGLFLPAFLVQVCFSQADLWLNHLANDEFNTAARGLFLTVCIFLTLPIFATYFALRVKNLLVAAILTWVALGIPVFMAFQVWAYNHNFASSDPWGLWPGLVLLVGYASLAGLTCFLLKHSLSRRIYSF